MNLFKNFLIILGLASIFGIARADLLGFSKRAPLTPLGQIREYYENHDYDNVIKSYKSAVASGKLNNPEYMALANMYLGISYHGKGDQDNGIKYIQLALDSGKLSPEDTAEAYMRLGESYYAKHDDYNGLKYYKLALASGKLDSRYSDWISNFLKKIKAN